MISALTPPTGAQAPFDPALIASMASALFGALPGEQGRAAGVASPCQSGTCRFPLEQPGWLWPCGARHAHSTRSGARHQPDSGITHTSAVSGAPDSGAAAPCAGGQRIARQPGDTVAGLRATLWQRRTGRARSCWAVRNPRASLAPKAARGHASRSPGAECVTVLLFERWFWSPFGRKFFRHCADSGRLFSH